MTELTPEVKAQCIEAIEKSDINGLYETLRIIIGESKNPNLIECEFTLSQLTYLENWSINTGLDRETIIRGLVDVMAKNKPELGTIWKKEAGKV